MTINERLTTKRAELAQAEIEQKQLWEALQRQDKLMRQAQIPWNDAHSKENNLRKEIEILEAMAKEMDAV